MQKFWSKLNLSQKIVFPFLIVCLTVLMVGLFAVGNWFANNLEQNLSEEVNRFSERIERDFQYEQINLESQLKLIADRESVRLAVERRDRAALLKILLPIRTILNLDLIKVVDLKGNTLMEARSSELGEVKILDASIVNSVSRGAGFADLLDVEGGQQILQAFIHPIKSSEGLLGGMIIAQSLDNQLLKKFASGSSKHLIVHKNGKVIASTLPSVPASKSLTITDLSTQQLTIDRQRYLAKSGSFNGVSQSLSVIALYPVTQLDAAKDLLWLRFGMIFLLEAIMVAIIGGLIANAIARPLKAVSQVAKRVTRDANFTLQVPVLTHDEVGVVAISLNQLIAQVRQLLIEQQESKQQLEIYNQTLEQQVLKRTEEFQQKNTDLQATLQQLKETQLQLIQGEKMSSLGQLVAGVAHEINNPVNFIHGNLTYANQHTQDLIHLLNAYQQHYPNPPQSLQAQIEDIDLEFLIDDLAKILQSMQVGSDRIRSIVLSLRSFSRLDEAEFKPVDLHLGIDNTLMILQHRLKSQNKRPEIKVVKMYGNIAEVNCFAGQLNQVFMNILANAIDALEEINYHFKDDNWDRQPCITIRTRLIDDCFVEIAIADNGNGIPEEIQRQIFDPFFTTKPVGKGTGMGMAISYQIITEKHNGKLTCHSTIGKGTEFYIQIPTDLDKSQ
ncbi:ATP-binding protein [Pseudanabaena sp. UWO310]|uniref:sensor histidine kinase n=1 Tax=Pseudanabaena sp. UWO310 TaxID=2480795 RepID=UPI0011574EA5|nr:ATP-binding protein [Pseudanabaena sp. UWO310]TYQ30920.1 HAMP domain-containing protein [Pseudanabaena sp. UWO310]